MLHLANPRFCDLVQVEPSLNERRESAFVSHANGDVKKNFYSKQSDYYVNGDGISRPELVQRTVSAAPVGSDGD